MSLEEEGQGMDKVGEGAAALASMVADAVDGRCTRLGSLRNASGKATSQKAGRGAERV